MYIQYKYTSNPSLRPRLNPQATGEGSTPPLRPTTPWAEAIPLALADNFMYYIKLYNPRSVSMCVHMYICMYILHIIVGFIDLVLFVYE